MSAKFASLALFALTIGLTACDKDPVEPTTPALRAKMDAGSLTGTSSYTESFKDANGRSTVDLSTSNQRLDMFTEFNTYMAQVALATMPARVDAGKLQGYYANTGNYFTGAGLNASGLQLRNTTAASFTGANAAAVRTYIDQNLANLAVASQRVDTTAVAGKAGRLGRYLVDAKGFELNQVVQKALIGAVLLDQIDNTLLTDQALGANNTKLVEGKLYSELEHNWDLAYGFLTSNAVMTTNIAATPRERFLAGYLNEKNGPASPGVYLAFLKGRAAIVNNDIAEAKNQANIIRTELERTIALAAVSYLTNWKSASDPAVKAHALGEGIGFVYSLRFCTKAGVDLATADTWLTGLTSGTRGAWDLTNAQIDAVMNPIKSKFNIQ